MDAQGATAALGENGKVAAGLRCFHHAKCVLLSRDRQILGIVAGDLQEDAAVGAAFIRLSGGVQEARTETENGGHFFLVADSVANRLQGLLIGGIYFVLGKDAKINARLRTRKISPHDLSQRPTVNLLYIFFVLPQSVGAL